MNEQEKAECKRLAIERAQKCSDGVVERRRMCGGCPMDVYCELEQKWRERIGPTFLDRMMADPVIRKNVTFIRLG